MKKALAFLLPLLLLGVSFSARADESVYSTMSGLAAPQSSTTYTYALNNVTYTVASTAIDLSTYAGVFVSVTGTGGASTVSVEWNHDSSNTSTWFKDQDLKVQSHKWLTKQSRYLRFVNKQAVARNLAGPSPKISVWYSAQTSASGSVGSVSQGAAGSSAWFQYDTISAHVVDTPGNSVNVVATPQSLFTAKNIYVLSGSSPTLVNLTTVVGTTCPLGLIWKLGSPSANIFWDLDLTYTASAAQMIAGQVDQFSANALPLIAAYPEADGGKITLMGNGGAATVSVSCGCLKAK